MHKHRQGLKYEETNKDGKVVTTRLTGRLKTVSDVRSLPRLSADFACSFCTLAVQLGGQDAFAQRYGTTIFIPWCVFDRIRWTYLHHGAICPSPITAVCWRRPKRVELGGQVSSGRKVRKRSHRTTGMLLAVWAFGAGSLTLQNASSKHSSCTASLDQQCP